MTKSQLLDKIAALNEAISANHPCSDTYKKLIASHFAEIEALEGEEGYEGQEKMEASKNESNEFVEKPKCGKCGRECATNTGKSAHERSCKVDKEVK
jgi:hypothetical protein